MRVEASPGADGWCPQCDGRLVPKCGPIVARHWAHERSDCDPWSEPESAWHLGWKALLRDRCGARVEVVRGSHRADAILPDGRVVELQSSYLSAVDIAAREAHWVDGVWLYRCAWAERLHWGARGFWWKHGAKSQVAGRWPLWWDMGDRLVMVSLGLSPNGRVVGRVLDTRPSR